MRMKPLILRGLCIASLATILHAQGSWAPIAPMPTAKRAFATAQTADGKVYAIAGDIFQGTYTPTNSADVYDPATNTWSALPPMPQAVYSATAAVSGGIIYVFGGYNGGPHNAVFAYNPLTSTWAGKAPLPFSRFGAAAVTTNNGRILVIGGDVQGGGQNISTVDIYDPQTDSWSGGPSLPAPRLGHVALLAPNGNILVFGGVSNGTFPASALSLDISTGAWSTIGNLQEAAAGGRASLATNGKVYVTGGSVVGGLSNFAQEYNLATNTSSFVTAMPAIRLDHGSEATIDGRVLVFGGWNAPTGFLEVLSSGYAFTPGPPPVLYSMCPLFDTNKAVKSGATLPIKLQICNSAGGNLSSASLVIRATEITQVSTSISGPVEAAGNANPDNDFRYDPALGETGGYIFNLKTTGLTTGTYALYFKVGVDGPTLSVQFQVK